MSRLAYRDKTGIWQIISHQMITGQKAPEILGMTPEHTLQGNAALVPEFQLDVLV